MDRVEKAALAFIAARRAKPVIPALPPDAMPQSPADAYAIQQRVSESLASAPAGWKVSLFPDGSAVFAPLLASLVVDSGATISAGPLARIGIELEFGFRFARDVPGAATPGQILDSIDSITTTIELCQTRFVSPDGHPALATLADFQNNRGAVIGARSAFDRNAKLGEVTTELFVDGKRTLERTASHPNGDPIAGLMVLPKVMAEHGRAIKAGQFAITGSFIGMNWFDTPRDGTKVLFEGRISGFGSVGVTVRA